MEFIMGDIMGMGMVGMVYYNMTGYILTRIIFFSLVALSVVGLFTTLKFLFKKRKPKETPGQKWLRTGKID